MRLHSILVTSIVASTAVTLLPGCGGDSDGRGVPAAVQKAAAQLDEVVPRFLARTGVPGAAVSVVYDNQVVYSRGFGVRKLGESAAVDADTVFQLASVSKAVGATVMTGQMPGSAVNGTNTWNTPIQQLLPWFELPYPDPQLNERLTLGQLYSHRSGLHEHAGDRLEVLGYDRSEILPRLRRAAMDDVGTYAYTNFGLTAAAQAMATASGTDWETLSERTLYQPLGMSRSSSRFADFAKLDNRAWGHVQVDISYDTYAKEPAEYKLAEPQRQPDAQSPAGGVSSSTNDMARWMMLVLNNGRWDGKQLLSPDALREAMTAQPGSVYGYGFNTGTDPGGHAYVSHSGAFMLGAATSVFMFPDDKLGITVLTNAQPRGLPEAIILHFSEQALQEAPVGQPSQDWLAFMQLEPAFHDLYKSVGNLADQLPPVSPAPPQPLTNYVGQYFNDYYGDATVALSSDGETLELTIGPASLHYVLRHWDGDQFVFYIESEDESPGSISAVQFDAAQMQIEYFGNDVTHGRYARVSASP